MAGIMSILLLLLLTSPPASSALSPTDARALAEIKSFLRDLPGTTFFSTWNFTSPDPCNSFSGISCSPDPEAAAPAPLRVSSLTLGTGLAGSPGISGTLPSAAIANLSALSQLIVHPGLVSGSIPSQIGSLLRLTFVSITGNLISGTIPDSLAGLPALHTLDLGHNRISGSIPPGLATMPSLKVLVLASNRVSGQVPPVRAPLLHLDLRGNALSGPLPPLPSSLRYFSASGNRMWGLLDGVGWLPDLEFIDLGMNGFSGELPAPLLQRDGIVLLLERNNLSGEIRAGEGGDGPVGATVDLSYNQLTGGLPAALAAAESLYVNNNRLTGPVPKEYVTSVYMGGMKTLYLQHNYLSSFPVPAGSAPPDGGALCISYNCMVPPVGPASCPARAGIRPSRPAHQCAAINGSDFNG